MGRRRHHASPGGFQRLDLGLVRAAITQDDGPGVPKDFVRKLFKPFSQADSSDTREKGGTGLGLSIAYELVQRMGGGIGYDRAEGGPTEFWFTVRIVEADAAFITRQQRAG